MASGGFGKSELWLQMVADIFQMNVSVSQTTEGSAWGAVLIGMKSIGINIPVQNKIKKTFFPNTACKAVYEHHFEKFKRVYPLLKDL
ncbi:autoinducer-2 (AI-2) kinase [compost metagenome]